MNNGYQKLNLIYKYMQYLITTKETYSPSLIEIL